MVACIFFLYKLNKTRRGNINLKAQSPDVLYFQDSRFKAYAKKLLKAKTSNLISNLYT